MTPPRSRPEQEIEALLRAYLRAIADGDYAAAADLLAPQVRRDMIAWVAEAYGDAEPDAATAIARLLGPADADALARSLEEVAVWSVKVEGDRAAAIVRGAVEPVRLRRIDGAWRIARVAFPIMAPADEEERADADADRRRGLRLSDGELGVASVLLTQPKHDLLATAEARHALRRLECEGLVEGRRLAGPAERLVETILRADLRLTVETIEPGGREVVQLWLAAEEGTVGTRVGDDELELHRIEAADAAALVLELLELPERVSPAPAPAGTLPGPAYDAAYERARAGDLDGAREELRAAADDPRHAALADAILDAPRSSRVTAAPADGEERSLALVDPGGGGLWRLYREGSGPSEQVRVRPLSSEQAADALRALLGTGAGTSPGATPASRPASP